MTTREKQLSAAVGLLVLVWGGNWAWNRYAQWHEAARSAHITVEAELQDARLQLIQARGAVAKLNAWRERSLPSDVNVAQSQYRAWLLEKLEAAKLQVGDVTPTGAGQRSDAYQALTYNVAATSDLAAVVRFLDQFYRSDQMHKISLLRLTPGEDPDDLRVTLNIEALVVQGTPRASGLSELESNRLELATAKEYVERITGRHFFTAYTPPKPPPPPRVVQQERRPQPPPRPRFDDSEHAYLTGLVHTGQHWQAWITVRTTDEKVRLLEGDKVEIGLLKGRVAEVTRRQLLIQTEDALLAIDLGDALRDGKRIDLGAGI